MRRRAWSSVVTRFTVLVVLTAVLHPAGLGAQIVAGTVTSEGTGAPVPGAVITLLDSAGTSTGYRTLTGVDGTYALRAPIPGRYRIEARAIGFVPRRGTEFTLGSGERGRSDVTMRIVTTRLANVQIRGHNACKLSTELDPVAGEVWDDVWAALASTEIALEQRLVPSDVFLYSRQVDAKSGVVVFENRSTTSVLAERPFRNATPEDLAKNGYRRLALDGGMALYAPDPRTLIAPSFLATHCFALGADSAQGGRIGLEFRPTRSRAPSDVQGTLWIDPDSRELRLLEFSYTGIPPIKGYRAEGHMAFTRLSNGVWVDDQWLIRYPVEDVGRIGVPRGSTYRIFSSSRAVLHGAVSMLESGGFVVNDSARRQVFGITGGYVQQNGRAMQSLADVEIEVLGTPLRVRADSGGAYNIPWIVPGTYDIRMLRAGRGEVGAFITRRTVQFAPGEGVRYDFTVPSDTSVALERCPRRKPDANTGVVVGVVRDSADGWPVANQPMDLEWTQSYAVGGARPIVKQRSGKARVTTDWRGEFVYCDAPHDSNIRVRVAQNRDAPWTALFPVGSQLTVIEVYPGFGDAEGQTRGR